MWCLGEGRVELASWVEQHVRRFRVFLTVAKSRGRGCCCRSHPQEFSIHLRVLAFRPSPTAKQAIQQHGRTHLIARVLGLRTQIHIVLPRYDKHFSLNYSFALLFSPSPACVVPIHSDICSKSLFLSGSVCPLHHLVTLQVLLPCLPFA